MAVWADTRAGTQASNKQDLARGQIDLPRRSGARAPLGMIGLAALLGGAVPLVRARAPRPGALDGETGG